jgi:hypothetical protein
MLILLVSLMKQKEKIVSLIESLKSVLDNFCLHHGRWGKQERQKRRATEAKSIIREDNLQSILVAG